MMRHKLLIVFVLLCSGLLMARGISAKEAGGLQVSPNIIDVGSFFSGSSLTISGDIPAAADVIVEITGKAAANSFEIKGRVGPFWMTTGKVKLENIPSLYLILLPEGKEWIDKTASLGLGMEQVRQHLLASGTVKVPKDIFYMFKKLKKTEGLYDEASGAVTYSKAENGTKHFVAKCKVPSSIALGNYLVTATIVENGVKTREVQGQLVVEEVGFVKFVNRLASDQRIIYGVSAVIIALAAGLLMGVIFRKSGGSH